MKRILLWIIATSWIALHSFAQDTIYLDKYARWTEKRSAIEYAIVKRTGQQSIKVSCYDLDGKLKRIENYSTYNKNQTIRQGYLLQFYPNGKKRREETYDKNVCIEGKLWAEDGSELPFQPYFVGPDCSGGLMNFARRFRSAIQYPNEAIRKKIEGQTILGFVINTEGRITDPKVLVSSHPLLDKSALNTLKKLTKKSVFTPAKIEGESVPYHFIAPANFRLPH